MERGVNMKHILDSVHGTIDIPKHYCDKIIDTCYFQRLRRIEQNSCRSVFPSARHDRFIHSLGVYHLGRKIADSIVGKCGPEGSNILPEKYETIIETYKMACLLHDVGHTPFSHTFEDYFNKDAVLIELKQIIGNDRFKNDIEKAKSNAASHETISAYVALKVFGETLKEFQIDLELLARMIMGYKYLDENDDNKPIGSFENVMIELIHGDIIDADGLDYVCRDVWAGGYKNFSIDLNRLIYAIEVERDQNGKYSVLYSSKALNEIETVLNVKNFQYLYVIKHHKVLLEQHILEEAMKSAACYHLGLPGEQKDDQRDNALRTLCDFRVFEEAKVLPKSQYKLYRPVDDDFVALMKLCDSEEFYIKQWLSRSFNNTPLWKSKLEYFNIFRPVFKTLSKTSIEKVHTLLNSDICIRYMCDNLSICPKDIIILNVESKVRSLDEKKIKVRLNDNVLPYSELNHDMFSVVSTKLPFCYIYVNLSRFGNGDKAEQIKMVISQLKEFILYSLKDEWN